MIQRPKYVTALHDQRIALAGIFIWLNICTNSSQLPILY